MKRKLIALAVASAFATPAAFAEVTVYGKVHMDIVSTETDTAPGNALNDVDNVTVNQNASRLGFKGTEDLGNGLNAIFKYETGYTGVDSATTFGSARNSYIGLNGDFGTFLVGRHDTPAKAAFYAAGNDHLGDSIIDLNRIGFTENRINNAIAYVSPEMAGMKIALAVVPGEQTGQDNTTDENGLIDSYSLGLMYEGHGLKAGMGVEKVAAAVDSTVLNGTSNLASNTAPDVKTVQLGASYTLDNITIGGQYGKNTNTPDSLNIIASNTDQTSHAVSGKYQFGNNALIANYGKQKQYNASVMTETDYVGLGLHHAMSKRTSAYVAYNQANVEDGDDTTQFGVGMIHNF